MLALLLAALAHAEPVTGYVDLHLHPAAYLASPMYGRGPDRDLSARTRYRHALRRSISAAELERSGATILVALAYANPMNTVFDSRRSMSRRIDAQLDWAETFCARHPNRLALAHTPAEARTAIAAGKTVIVLGIEGATKLMDTPADAAALAQRGVAVVTPIHLADNELGGAMCMTGSYASFNLPGCRRERRDPASHGLTPKGTELVNALIDAGVVIDLAHASPASFDQLLGLVAAHHVAPVYTHVTARSVRDDASSVSDAQLRSIYALGGLVGVTANLHSIAPQPALTDPPAGYCPGSIDDLQLHWDHVVHTLPGEPVAWGSDFQGGVTHIRPKYGPDGCSAARPDGAPLDAFDTRGLAHVGLVPAMFDHLVQAGSDRAPLDASAERFLEIWERARHER